MNYSIQQCGILIIAAGQSKRLGQPKQLLTYQGKTLLNRLIENVQTAVDLPITLVLGAHSQTIQDQLPNDKINIVVNNEWQEGMGGSIKCGLAQMLQSNPKMDGIMILVCDQPFITGQSIQDLLQLQQAKQLPMAACYYADILGTPALFHQTMFPALLALNGDVGAKKIINSRPQEVVKLHFEQGVVDIDTMEDYQQLMK